VLATALAYNVPLTASSSRVVRTPDVVARELTFTANLEVQTPYAKASGGRDSRPVHRATPASAHVPYSMSRVSSWQTICRIATIDWRVLRE